MRGQLREFGITEMVDFKEFSQGNFFVTLGYYGEKGGENERSGLDPSQIGFVTGPETEKYL